MRYIDQANLREKKILCRVDFNVPIEDGKVLDDYKIRSFASTLNYLREQDAKVSLLMHLGRPEGKPDESLRTEHLVDTIKEFWPGEILPMKSVFGDEVDQVITQQAPEQLVLLENVRFWPGEESSDEVFANQIAEPFEAFVQDAFGNAHRSHASMVSLSETLPTYYGFLFKKELDALDKVVKNPDHPFVFIIGGIKVETKLGLIKKALEIADHVLLGSAISEPFFRKELGLEVSELLGELVDRVNNNGQSNKLVFPEDGVFGESKDGEVVFSGVTEEGFKRGLNFFDIGRKTVMKYQELIAEAKTIIWNGPLGVFENKNFAVGSEMITRAVGDAKGYTIVGGGETVDLVRNLDLADKINHVSTGGGAMLYYLENETFPLLENET